MLTNLRLAQAAIDAHDFAEAQHQLMHAYDYARATGQTKALSRIMLALKMVKKYRGK